MNNQSKTTNHGHDPVDYDGMGNHGRFPPEGKKEAGNTYTDALLIILCLAIPVIYIMVQ